VLSTKFRNHGNKLYKKKKYAEALEYFNKSLCYAEKIDSKEATLCFGSRSIVYVNLGLPEQCKDNILLASIPGSPSEKMELFHSRQEKYDEMMRRKKDPVKDFFKLSYPAHENIPFLANCIELQTTKKYGRGLYATQDIDAGGVIAVEKPIMRAIFEDGYYIRCINCLESKSMNLMPCSGCTCGMFCSRKCQDEAMEHYHQIECSQMTECERGPLNAEIFPSLSRIVLQSIKIAGGLEKLRAICANKSLRQKTFVDYDLRQENNPSLELNQLLTAFGHLTIRSLKANNGTMKWMASDGWIHLFPLRLVWSSQTEKKAIKLILKTIVDICYNQLFQRKELKKTRTRKKVPESEDNKDDSMSRHFGTGLNILNGYVNHSCMPNIYRIPMDIGLVYITLAPIKKGEQIFTSYG